MPLTFNPGAIPVSVLMLAFAVFVGTRRTWILDTYDRSTGRERTASSRNFQMRYALFISAAGVLLAAFVLFYDFNS